MRVIITEQQHRTIREKKIFQVMDMDFEKYLSNDKFKKNHNNNDPLIVELNRVKNEFREFLNTPMEESRNAIWAYNKIREIMLQIAKIRFMIEPKFHVWGNVNAVSGVKYVVLRSEWYDEKGNKIKKFSVNLGRGDEEISKERIQDGERIIKKQMWDLYKEEYPL